MSAARPWEPWKVIGGSAAHPFEVSERQFFIQSTGWRLLSTLVETREACLQHLEDFPMGYTQLWVHRRVGLLLPGQRLLRYPDPRMGLNPRQPRLGRYYPFAASGWRTDHVPNDGTLPAAEPFVLGFGSFDGALAAGLSRPEPEDALIITRLVDDIFWH